MSSVGQKGKSPPHDANAPLDRWHQQEAFCLRLCLTKTSEDSTSTSIDTSTMEHLESALRPVLQPITQNLPGPIRDLGISLLGNHCYKTLVHDVQLSDASCFKLAISKGLGIGIIGASAVVKIPQLLKLLNSQSAAGLSFLAYALETSSYLISLAYNARMGFPFSTYGETAFIAIQNVAIAALILQYSGKGAAAAAFVAGLAAAGYSLFNPNVIDMKTMSLLQAGAGALGVASKLPQIITVWQQGGTGQLSAFAVSHHSLDLSPQLILTPPLPGLQLPLRLSFAHLHDSPRSRRQAHPLRLHLWLRPQRCARSPDDLLLEQCSQQSQRTLAQVG